MKRILYIGGFELPDKNAAAQRVLSIAKAWRDAGIEVVFLGVSKCNGESDIFKTKECIQGFSTYSIPYPQKKMEWIDYLVNIEPVKQLINSFETLDGVVCYNYQAVAFEKLRRYCKQSGIKIYSDCTEWYNTAGTNLIFKLLKGGDTWYRMTVVQKKLDGMIVISDYLKDYYRSCKNVVVIPPLVDVEEEKWSEKSKNLGNMVNFIYAGMPGNKDKIWEIIIAYRNLAKNYKCKLWVVGISKEQFLTSYPAVKEEDIPDTVVFLGRVSHKESIAYLKGADCSLVIRDSTRTNNAGFPTKFAEAITLGVGVIATDISDLGKYSDRLGNVLIVKGSLYNTMESFILRGMHKMQPNSLFDYRNWAEQLVMFLD